MRELELRYIFASNTYEWESNNRVWILHLHEIPVKLKKIK